MSTGNLQILYYIYAPNSTAADFAEKSKTHLDEHVVWIKACAAAGTVRKLQTPLSSSLQPLREHG